MAKTLSQVQTQYTSTQSPLPVWRSRLVVFLLFIMFSSLIIRGLWIQWFNNDFYEEQGNKRIERTIKLLASRGKILDRNNNNLATSLNKKTIWADPAYIVKLQNCAKDPDFRKDKECRPLVIDIKKIKEFNQKLPKLANLLSLDATQLKQRLLNKDRSFIYVKHQIEEDIAENIKKLNLPGIYSLIESKRFYTQGEVTAQLIGITSLEDVGQEGLELAFNKYLTGKSGQSRVVKDRLGNVVDDKGIIKQPTNGKDLVLSIDSHLQTEVYNALKQAVQTHKAKLGTAVVLDAKTGETLAIANWPSYNPNNRTANAGEIGKNHALTDTFEPGSTMKPLTIAAALDKGLIKGNSVFDVSSLNISGKNITDSHRYSKLSTLEIIQKSSNIGTVKIANLMDNESQWSFYRQVGLGQVPAVNFPGSASGRLRNFKTWRPIEKATMSYGYGLSTSIFQIAQAYTIFANDGKFIPATLFKRDINSITPRQVITPETNKVILQALEMVTQPGGTAIKAQIQGYRVGGKTGTAHKQVGNGYSHNTYRAFFAGLAPMSNPRIIVAVMVDEPSNGSHYGGEVSAPVFSRVTEVSLRVLNVPMDKEIAKPSTANKPNNSASTTTKTTGATQH
ncbi:MAG: hypothetical protein RLZZ210_1470 [Pseudomonadota bacterium]